MIVRLEGDRLVIVRQADHARLSGRLAATWGRAPWTLPSPSPAVLVAARQHDDAWVPYDEAPDVEAGRPLAFFEVDRRRAVRLYAAGVTAVAGLDPYAGLLVSLHYTGFFTSHWGWQPFSTPDRFPEPQATALRAFLHAEAARRETLRAAAGPEGPGDARLRLNYTWLQLWDRISLDICRQSASVPWALEYPAVSVSEGGATVALKFAMVAPGSYTLNPYPLLPDPFVASVPAVTVEAGAPSEAAFLERWRTAPETSLSVSIGPA